MARVPTAMESGLGDLRTKVTGQQTLSGEIPLDALGGAEARRYQENAKSFSRADTAIDRALTYRQKIHNTTAAKEADVAAAGAIRELMYGQDGFMVTRGRDSVDRLSDMQQRLNDVRQTFSKDLSPDAASVYNGLVENRISTATSTAMRHSNAQWIEWANLVDETAVKEAFDAAIASGGDPNQVGQSIAIIDSAIDEQTERNGWSPEVAESKREAAITKLHKGVIEEMIAQSRPSDARAYYNDALGAGEIDGVDRAALEKLLFTNELVMLSQQHTDAIITKHGNNWEDALNAARQIDDPAVRAAVVDGVSARISEANKLATVENKRLRTEAYRILEENGGNLRDIKPEHLDALGISVGTFRDYARELREGEEPVQDWDTYYTLHKLYLNQPDAFLKTDLDLYRGKLDDTNYERVLQWQRGLVSTSRTGSNDDVRTTTQQISDTLYALGFQSSGGGKNAQRFNQAEIILSQSLQAATDKKGSDLTYNERQKIIDSHAIELTDPHFGGSDTRSLLEIQADALVEGHITFEDAGLSGWDEVYIGEDKSIRVPADMPIAELDDAMRLFDRAGPGNSFPDLLKKLQETAAKDARRPVTWERVQEAIRALERKMVPSPDPNDPSPDPNDPPPVPNTTQTPEGTLKGTAEADLTDQDTVAPPGEEPAAASVAALADLGPVPGAIVKQVEEDVELQNQAFTSIITPSEANAPSVPQPVENIDNEPRSLSPGMTTNIISGTDMAAVSSASVSISPLAPVQLVKVPAALNKIEALAMTSPEDFAQEAAAIRYYTESATQGSVVPAVDLPDDEQLLQEIESGSVEPVTSPTDPVEQEVEPVTSPTDLPRVTFGGESGVPIEQLNSAYQGVIEQLSTMGLVSIAQLEDLRSTSDIAMQSRFIAKWNDTLKSATDRLIKEEITAESLRGETSENISQAQKYLVLTGYLSGENFSSERGVFGMATQVAIDMFVAGTNATTEGTR